MKLLKKIYILLFNWKYIIYFKKYKLDLFIGRGTKINRMKYLFIEKNIRIGKFGKINFFDKFSNKTYNPKLIIQDNVYIGDFFTVLCADKIIIQKNVLIADYVSIISENHGVDLSINQEYSQQELETKPILIKEGVWIGEKVTILPGVVIGKKSIIGAGSVVTRDIEDFSIVAGNPAKIIKKYDFNEKKWRKSTD